MAGKKRFNTTPRGRDNPMNRPPRLDEVFLVNNRNTINVGSAYTKTVGAFNIKEATMKPELEKVVQKYAGLIAEMIERARPGSDIKKLIATQLEYFAHEMEKAEGEDPAELDQGGPPAGSTGPGEGQRDPTKGFNGGGDL